MPSTGMNGTTSVAPTRGWRPSAWSCQSVPMPCAPRIAASPQRLVLRQGNHAAIVVRIHFAVEDIHAARAHHVDKRFHLCRVAPLGRNSAHTRSVGFIAAASYPEWRKIVRGNFFTVEPSGRTGERGSPPLSASRLIGFRSEFGAGGGAGSFLNLVYCRTCHATAVAAVKEQPDQHTAIKPHASRIEEQRHTKEFQSKNAVIIFSKKLFRRFLLGGIVVTRTPFFNPNCGLGCGINHLSAL